MLTAGSCEGWFIFFHMELTVNAANTTEPLTGGWLSCDSASLWHKFHITHFEIHTHTPNAFVSFLLFFISTLHIKRWFARWSWYSSWFCFYLSDVSSRLFLDCLVFLSDCCLVLELCSGNKHWILHSKPSCVPWMSLSFSITQKCVICGLKPLSYHLTFFVCVNIWTLCKIRTP